MNLPIFLLKVRDNVIIEDDIQLVEYELKNLFGQDVYAYQNVSDALSNEGLNSVLVSIPALSCSFREGGVGTFVARNPRVNLEELVRRLGYIQEIIIVAQGRDSNELLAYHNKHPWNSRIINVGNYIVLRIIPLFCLLELADGVLQYAHSGDDIPALLDTLVAALLSEKLTVSSMLKNVLTRKTSTYLGHDLHIYKAKFFPRMVRSLINAHLLDLSDKILLDPFVGSGTALLEAQTMGLRSIGIDLDPLCVAISQAKAELVFHDPAQFANTHEQLKSFITEHSLRYNFGLFEGKTKSIETFRLPSFIREKLPESQAREIENDVSLIKTAIKRAVKEVETATLLKIALSDAISRKLRLRFLGTGHGRFAIEMRKDRVLELFLSHVHQIRKILIALHYVNTRFGLQVNKLAQVFRGNALATGLESNSVDLIITSPPYLPAASGRESYVLGKAASLLALELVREEDLHRLNDELMGSMSTTNMCGTGPLPEKAITFIEWLQQDMIRNIKAEPTLRYYSDLRKALEEFRRVLKPGGVCAVVVAKAHTFYRYKNREILYILDNAEIVKEIGQMVGLEFLKFIHLKLDKVNVLARPRSRDEYFESIVIFKKIK